MNQGLGLPNAEEILEALRASEISYRRLFEAAQDGILILDSATGRVIDVNPFLVNLLGFSHDDMVGRTVGDLSPFKDLVSNQKMLEKLQKVGYVRYENLPLETSDGRKIAVEFVSNVYQAGNQQVIQCNIRDITVRHEAELALLASEERYRLINDASVDQIYSYDLDNRFTSANRVLCANLGRRADEVIGKTYWELGFPESLCREWDELHRQVYALGSKVEVLSTPMPNGTVHHFKVNLSLIHDGAGVVTGIAGVNQDLTEKKQLELYQEMGLEVLQILNTEEVIDDALPRILSVMKQRTGFDSVGIRLKVGEDYPYLVQEGFSDEFLRTENTLLERTEDGGICWGNDGHGCLECSCGLVLSTPPDQAVPPLTPGGTFWTNDSFQLLQLPPDQDSRHYPRNTCVHQGYASVALVPIREKGRQAGLIQFNDRRPDRFTSKAIELLEGIGTHIGESLMRMHSDLALRESERRLNSILDSQKIGVWDLDWQTRIAYHTLIHDQIFGYQTLLPHWTFEMFLGHVLPEDLPEVHRSLQESLASKKDQIIECRIRRADGDIRHIRINATMVLNQDGEISRIMGLTQDISEKKGSELRLASSHEQLHTLLAQLRRAQEDERIRISREIHDELGQLLTGLKMDVRWLERRLSEPGLPPALNPLLDRVVGTNELADAMLATVQRIAAELRPSTLDSLGLEATIALEARQFQERSGVRCTVAPENHFPVLSPVIANNVYYICREALTNAGRHAHATHVELSWHIEGDTAVFTVCDDGVGMVETEGGTRQSLGLTGMRVTVRVPCTPPGVKGSDPP